MIIFNKELKRDVNIVSKNSIASFAEIFQNKMSTLIQRNHIRKPVIYIKTLNVGPFLSGKTDLSLKKVKT